VTALASLAAQDAVPATTVADAIGRYGIDPETPPPWTV
jgi:pyruvate dehydrogenase E1 component